MRPLPLASALLLATAVLAGIAGPGLAQFDSLGSGAGWFDCNEDGWLDVFLLTPRGNLVLFVYDPGTGRFVDESGAFPPAMQGVNPGAGVACGDVNNDGLEDLFLTFGPNNLRQGGGNHLFLNRGNSTFQLVSRTAGIVPGAQGEALSASAALFDYDGNGLLDIYVTNYGDPIYANDGWANQLFRNDGLDGSGIPRFVDVAASLGVDRGRRGQSNWSLGAVTGDYDNDGDLDLYVVNDYNGIDPVDGFLRDGDNTLYRNEGNGTFADVSYEANAADPGWGMGGAFGDVDNDGWLDLIVTNFWEDALLRNNRDGTFTDITAAAGLPTARDPFSDPPCTVCNGWGTGFVDIDNDGDLDLHVVNGYITNSEGQSVEEPDQLWENLGPGPGTPVTFREVGFGAGVESIGDGRGAAYGDVNRDGFVDILVMNNQFIGGAEPVPDRVLYVNQKDGTFRDLGFSYAIRESESDTPPRPPRGDYSGNRWLQVRPVGVQSNRSAIGTRVTVEAGGKRWIREVGAGSFCSTSSQFLHFGLGAVAAIDRLVVRFPTGTEIVKNAPPLDSFLTVAEDDPTPVRLLAFAALDGPQGMEVRWELAQDGEASAVTLVRETEGGVVDLVTVPALPAGPRTHLDPEAPLHAALWYHLDASLRDGSRERVGSIAARRGAAPRLALGQNRPNPFSGSTWIPVEGTPAAGDRILVLDAAGRLVRELPVSRLDSGGAAWDGRDARGRRVAPGTYFYRISGSGRVRTMIHRP